MSKRKRHTPEEIICKLREAESLLAADRSVPDAAKVLGVSEATFNRWRHQYGGMKGPEVERPKELECENAHLKKLLAEQAHDIDMLKEVAKGYF